MGGQHETIIAGLRMHINTGKVHIHDDSKKLKFECSNKDFKSKVEDAIEQLDDQDGIVKIVGDTDAVLYLLKDNKTFSIFLDDTKNKISKIRDLIDIVKRC